MEQKKLFSFKAETH